MQDHVDFARKNGVELRYTGPCQLCGAPTERGIEECLEIFHLSFQNNDLSQKTKELNRFLTVDAHALQHPEIHGRWSNHFHLLRLHLIFTHKVQWSYRLSPLLSDTLNAYKKDHSNEVITPPHIGQRGTINSVTVLKHSEAPTTIIQEWASEVYNVYSTDHAIMEPIALTFLNDNKTIFYDHL